MCFLSNLVFDCWLILWKKNYILNGQLFGTHHSTCPQLPACFHWPMGLQDVPLGPAICIAMVGPHSLLYLKREGMQKNDCSSHLGVCVFQFTEFSFLLTSVCSMERLEVKVPKDGGPGEHLPETLESHLCLAGSLQLVWLALHGLKE